jgi:hypothetical protein
MPDFSVNFVVTRAESKAAHEAEDKAYKDHVKNADKAAKSVEASATREVSARKKAAAEILTAEQVAAAAKVELIKRTNAAQVKAAADAADAVKKAALATKDADAQMASAAAVGGKLAGVFGMIGNAAFGLNGISSVITMIAESFERAKNQAVNAAKFADDYRKSLKEIAFLKGEAQPTAKLVLEDLAFRQKTLQTKEGARETQEQFRNVAGISIDTKDTKRRISKEDAEDAMVFAGQLGSRVGGDGDIGKLAGIIPMTEGKDRVSGDDVKRRLYQLSLLGQAGGASPGQFASQMAGSSYLTTTGAYKSFARQGAVGSAISIGTPTEIGTGFDQIHRATIGSLSDVSKPMGATMAPADYLKSIKATDQMDDLEILQAMFADIEKAEAAQKQKGLKLDLTGYLKDKGYGNIHDIGRVSQLYGARADLTNTLIPMANKLPTLDEANEQFNTFKGGPTGQAQAGAVNADRVSFAVGGGAMEYYKTLEARAIQSGQTPGGIMPGDQKDWEGSRTASNRMLEMLRQEGMAKGLDWSIKERDDGRGGTRTEDPLASYFRGYAGTKERASGYYELAQRVKGAGGDPYGSHSDIIKSSEESLRNIADAQIKSAMAMETIAGKLNPPPVAVVQPGGANSGPVR